MAFSSPCHRFFFLLFLVMAASPLQTLARESKFFSKNPKPEIEKSTIALSPSPSPSPSPATVEQGYGLFGQEETNHYSPTTTNPTKSAPEKYKYVQPNWVKDTNNNNGYHYETGEKQGMSDTRFMENGKYFYDVKNEKEVESNEKLMENGDGHQSYYGNNYENENHYNKERYGTGEKQGMSDTRFLENGKYFYDVEGGKKNNGYGNEVQSNHENTNNFEFYSKNNYENEEEEEEEEKYNKEGYGTGEKQGMKNGRYFYDTEAEKNHNYNGYEMERNNGYGNNVEFYNNNNNDKNNEYYEKESSEPEKYAHNGNGSEFEEEEGKGYGFTSTPNKFPGHEFDSVEEYERYEKNKPHLP